MDATVQFRWLIQITVSLQFQNRETTVSTSKMAQNGTVSGTSIFAKEALIILISQIGYLP